MQNKNNGLLSQILDIQRGRYDVARSAMDIINDLAENPGTGVLDNMKEKPALYAIYNALDKDKQSDGETK